METTKRKPGRPATGNEYPYVKPVRLGDQDIEAVTALASKWRCSEAAAIRRAIQETAERVIGVAVANETGRG